MAFPVLTKKFIVKIRINKNQDEVYKITYLLPISPTTNKNDFIWVRLTPAYHRYNPQYSLTLIFNGTLEKLVFHKYLLSPERQMFDKTTRKSTLLSELVFLVVWPIVVTNIIN